jgi:glycosyltransferase involved in cell wall biosynthesis
MSDTRTDPVSIPAIASPAGSTFSARPVDDPAASRDGTGWASVHQLRPLPWISIVGPVHDERPNLRALYDEVRAAMAGQEAAGRSWELVLVDDASTDGSLEELLRLAHEDPRVRVLRHSIRRGQSAALAAGFRAARGLVTVTLDTDLQNDPADIPALLEPLDAHDLVCGVRRHRRDPLSKRLASRVANRLRRLILHDGLHDVGCGLRAARTELLRELPPFDGLHRFIGPLLVGRGARVVEVPVHHRPRTGGRSKYGVHDRLWRGLWDLIGVRWLGHRMLGSSAAEELETPT